METASTIESKYIQTVSLEHRKRYAQFFTPSSVADMMALWLTGNKKLNNVLEPAFGLGVFTRSLLKKKENIEIKGFDIDEEIISNAWKEFSCFSNVKLHLQDYIYSDWENKYDGIICNPPYFKFHDYDNKAALNEIEKRLNCKLNGFTNLYALFLLKSLHQLNKNGRCAYLVPSEFLNSDYGALVKYYLIKSKMLRHIIVFDFEENVFDDAITTACIVLCSNDDETDKVQFVSLKSIEDIDVISRIIEGYPLTIQCSTTYKAEDLNPFVKWRKYYKTNGKREFTHLTPFSNYAKVMRGIATGANDYFTFNKSKAERFNINERYLLPCICHCTDVKGFAFTESKFEALKEEDKKVFLFNVIHSEDENVKGYINNTFRHPPAHFFFLFCDHRDLTCYVRPIHRQAFFLISSFFFCASGALSALYTVRHFFFFLFSFFFCDDRSILCENM